MIRPRFARAAGLNASERILAEIADRSFLKLWTWPNTYKERNRELTDLTIVFGDDVLLISDKGGAYPDSGDAALDWRRYYRSAIADSARQIRTAEQWIRRFRDRVYLDVHCENPLPVALPSADRVRVHRICVAPAATEAARLRASQTGLAIEPGTVGDAQPYAVGEVAGCQGWVHVFDEDSVAVLLPALSTTPDFIDYLRAKEALIAQGGLQAAASEKDLLAVHLRHERAFPQEGRPLMVPAGTWDELAAHPQFIEADKLNQQGALWDAIIERVTAAIVEGDAIAGNDISIADSERLMRRMASEDRFGRRVLSRAILERAVRAVGAAVSSILPSQADPGLAYVLLVSDHDQREPYEDYRRFRAAELHVRCQAAAVARPDVTTIIGLGLDAANGRGGSEDFVYLDAGAATPLERAEWARRRAVMGYFIEGQAEENRLIEDEYPDLA